MNSTCYSFDLWTVINLPSFSGSFLNTMKPESPRLHVCIILGRVWSNFTKTHVLDPLISYFNTLSTLSVKICFKCYVGSWSNLVLISVTNCFEYIPLSIPCIAHPPTPSATTSKLLEAIQASSPPLSFLSSWGILEAPY